MTVELTEKEIDILLRSLLMYQFNLPITIEAEKIWNMAEQIITKIEKEKTNGIELTEEEANVILRALFRFAMDLPLTIEADRKYILAEKLIGKIGKELN